MCFNMQEKEIPNCTTTCAGNQILSKLFLCALISKDSYRVMDLSVSWANRCLGG